MTIYIKGDILYCNRCESTQKIPFPLSVKTMDDLSASFRKQHSKCRNSDAPDCFGKHDPHRVGRRECALCTEIYECMEESRNSKDHHGH